MQRLAAGAAVAASVLLAAAPGLAAGGPTPVYSPSCVVGGSTRADWQRAKLVQVAIEWSAPEGSGVAFTPTVAPTPKPTPPRGFVTTVTPSVAGVDPVSATFSFERTDGTVDVVTTPCS